MGCSEGELGVLREGALADLIVVDLEKPHLQPVNDAVANLVYCGKASDVETVMVGGRIVVENRRIPGWTCRISMRGRRRPSRGFGRRSDLRAEKFVFPPVFR